MKPSAKWPVLKARLTEAHRKRTEAEPPAPRGALPLQELRRVRRVSQEVLAHTLGAKQPSVSRIERQEDMHVSTLRKYIEALGGRLELVARFPQGAIRLKY